MALLYLGEIAEKRGDFAQAEMYLQEGLLLARRGQQHEYIPTLLAKLGNMALLKDMKREERGGGGGGGGGGGYHFH